MKVFKNTTIPNYKGEPIKLQFPNEPEAKELVLKQILWMILNNAPIKTQQDCKQGALMATALDACKDRVEVIEIEEGTHDWLKPIAEELTPALFRVNGHLVYEHICEGFEKANQPSGKKE